MLLPWHAQKYGRVLDLLDYTAMTDLLLNSQVAHQNELARIAL